MGVVVQETRLGMPLEASLERLRDRLPSREVAVLMTTLIIQQRAGGDTVRALSELGQTLEARKDLLREIRTMLSGAVFTSYLVAGMGAGTILMINAISPGIMRQLTTTLAGLLALTVSVDALRHRVRPDQADHEGGDVTPGLAGLLAAVAVGIGLAGIPMLRDRGPEERLGLRDRQRRRPARAVPAPDLRARGVVHGPARGARDPRLAARVGRPPARPRRAPRRHHRAALLRLQGRGADPARRAVRAAAGGRRLARSR